MPNQSSSNNSGATTRGTGFSWKRLWRWRPAKQQTGNTAATSGNHHWRIGAVAAVSLVAGFASMYLFYPLSDAPQVPEDTAAATPADSNHHNDLAPSASASETTRPRHEGNTVPAVAAVSEVSGLVPPPPLPLAPADSSRNDGLPPVPAVGTAPASALPVPPVVPAGGVTSDVPATTPVLPPSTTVTPPPPMPLSPPPPSERETTAAPPVPPPALPAPGSQQSAPTVQPTTPTVPPPAPLSPSTTPDSGTPPPSAPSLPSLPIAPSVAPSRTDTTTAPTDGSRQPSTVPPSSAATPLLPPAPERGASLVPPQPAERTAPIASSPPSPPVSAASNNNKAPATSAASTSPVSGASSADAPHRPPTTSYDVDIYEPKPGDTWESISRDFYHDPRFATALRLYNRNKPLHGSGPIDVPPLHILRRHGGGGFVPAAGSSPTPSPPASSGVQPAGRSVTTGDPWSAAPPTYGAPASSVASGGLKIYRVPVDGLSLPAIARQLLGNERRWVEIYDLNPDVNASRVPAGTELRLPPDARIP